MIATLAQKALRLLERLVENQELQTAILKEQTRLLQEITSGMQPTIHHLTVNEVNR